MHLGVVQAEILKPGSQTNLSYFVLVRVMPVLRAPQTLVVSALRICRWEGLKGSLELDRREKRWVILFLKGPVFQELSRKKLTSIHVKQMVLILTRYSFYLHVHAILFFSLMISSSSLSFSGTTRSAGTQRGKGLACWTQLRINHALLMLFLHSVQNHVQEKQTRLSLLLFTQMPWRWDQIARCSVRLVHSTALTYRCSHRFQSDALFKIKLSKYLLLADSVLSLRKNAPPWI